MLMTHKVFRHLTPICYWGKRMNVFWVFFPQHLIRSIHYAPIKCADTKQQQQQHSDQPIDKCFSTLTVYSSRSNHTKLYTFRFIVAQTNQQYRFIRLRLHCIMCACLFVCLFWKFALALNPHSKNQTILFLSYFPIKITYGFAQFYSFFYLSIGKL